MSIFRKYPATTKGISLFLAFSIFGEIFFPTMALALTSGPTSPEFSSFEPVATTDMVDPFSGDFTYNLPVVNIPGADGGGYAMSLSYHSGASPEEEASWVGYGWTLNAGAINRGKVGYVDEFENVSVRKFNKVVPNWTISALANMNLEFFSSSEQQDKENNKKQSKAKKENSKPVSGPWSSNSPMSGFEDVSSDFTIGISKSIRYNNYSGLMKSTGFSASFKGMASLNMNFAGGNATFGFSVNPLKALKAMENNQLRKADIANDVAGFLKHINKFEKLKKLNKKLARTSKYFNPNITGSANISYPGLTVNKTRGKSYNFSGTLGVNPLGPVGVEFGYQGNFNLNIPQSETDIAAYGYLHRKGWDDNWDDETDVFEANDYFIEGETTLSKTDKNLGIPFSGADVFSATGEGLMGGFRFKDSRVDHFYPSKITNKEVIQNIGLEFAVGQTIQVGLDVGFGWHRTLVSNWESGKRGSTTGDMYKPDPNNQAFLEFMNDPGKVFRYTVTDAPVAMRLDGKELSDNENDFVSGLTLTTTNLASDASSVIQFTTFGNATNPQNRMDKMQATQDFYGSIASDPILSGMMRELKVVKPDGSKYIYGASVVARNELNLTVGLRDANGMEPDQGTNPYLTTTYGLNANDINNIENNFTAQGDFIAQPYTNSFLITQILTPNYVDVNDNGPDDRDYGGWTKFTYRKRYGASGSWYRHRAPYTEMYYNKGRVSNPYDQTGSFSSGEREVAYLKTIETKTHIAFFVTSGTSRSDFQAIGTELGLTGAELTAFLSYFPEDGTNVARKDGLDAATDEEAASGTKGTHTLEQLNKIILFSKNRLTKPVSVTHFEYSNEAWPGVPNVTSSGAMGKLTLKKVWTDTEGLAKARIAPYQFEYTYFKKENYPVFNNYLAEGVYGDFDNLNETPGYAPGLLDNWGNYQYSGVESNQRNLMREWGYQGTVSEQYDPAAWQLKRIILPSGGEIHVQYEEKDYCYVQDKLATTLVSIDPSLTVGNSNKYEHDENKYYLNLDDVGIETIEQKKAYFLKLARQFFSGSMAIDGSNENDYEIHDGETNKSKDKMVFFRFLYSYGDDAVNLQQPRGADFVEGYCPVYRIGYQYGKIYLGLGGPGDQKYLTPRRIAHDQLISAGNLAMDQNTFLMDGEENIDAAILDRAYDNVSDGYDDEIKETKQYLLNNSGKSLRGRIAEAIFAVNKPQKHNIAKAYDPARSAFKLVVPEAKRGGGVRVKRLLMYNPGIEAGEASVYGSEYIYETKDGKSSGVATNEPGGSHMENAIVDILPRYKQLAINKLLAGKDKSWAEGPLGAHLYPNASVGHSRVVIKNIHSGKSSPGFVINEYLTCKDVPTVTVQQTELKDPGVLLDNRIKDYYKKTKFSLPLGMLNYSQDKAWVTQGYVFEINDMHGQLQRSYTYNGTYENYLDDPNSASVYASVENEYSSGQITVVRGEIENGQLKLTKSLSNLGIEEDIAMYSSRVEDRTFDFSIELDLNFLIQFPIVCTFGFGFTINYDETELSQHVTNRVIRRTPRLIASTTFQDGIRTRNETLAYNNLDGAPLITRVSSAYNAPDQIGNFRKESAGENTYYTMNIPAPWIYAEMGKKSNNPNHLNLLTASAGGFTTHMENPLDKFASDVWYPYSNDLDRVVSASASEFQKNRFTDQINYLLGGQASTSSMTGVKADFDAEINNTGFGQDDLDQLNAMYYPVRGFAFIGDRTSANDPLTGAVYKDGIIKNFEFFQWTNSQPSDLETLNPNWQSPSYVTKFSPNGMPLEEVNLLGIRSSAHYGYGKLLPTIIGTNAEYETILFEDYETHTATGVAGSVAHTGKKALNYAIVNNGLVTDQTLTLTSNLEEKGARVKFWVRYTSNGNDPFLTEVMNLNPRVVIGGQNHALKRIATVGEWHLLSADIQSWGNLQQGDVFSLKCMFDPVPQTETLLLDDICFHPLDAMVNMTVYNTTDFKVVAQLDDQHFAAIYEYNQEGMLVRTIVETEKGRKTLTEKQVNTPKKPR